MRTKTNKVPKSAKSKLSDLTPEKDARGGRRSHKAASRLVGVDKPDAVRPSSSAFPPHLPV
jgi:hypothetical protein